MTRPRTTWGRRAAVLLVILPLSPPLWACGDDDGSAATTSTAVSMSSLSSYADIDALHEQLVEAGVDCGLEYEGLEDEGKEVSICVIEGEQALLSIWDDPDLIADFAASATGQTDTVAVGRNWTVDVDTGQTARLVADALGGVLPADLTG